MVPESSAGATAGPYEEEIGAARVQAFAAVVGAEPGAGVPPTFLTLFRRGEFELLQELGVELNHVLHGEQEYSYEERLRVGDRVRYETCLARIRQKKSPTSSMQILTFETRFDVASRPVATSRTTMIVRSGEQSRT